MDVAVGLIDVKNTWIEPAELVAERLRQVLGYVEPERVSVTPDCGFSQTAATPRGGQGPGDGRGGQDRQGRAFKGVRRDFTRTLISLVAEVSPTSTLTSVFTSFSLDDFHGGRLLSFR